MCYTIIRGIMAAGLLLAVGACTQPRPSVVLIEPTYSHLRDGEQRPNSATALAQRPGDPMVFRR